DGEQRPLVEDEGTFYAGPWHPDGRRIAVMHFQGNDDQDVFLLDVHSGERTPLTPHEGHEVNAPVGFSADGRHVYLATNRDHEFTWLARRSLDGDGSLEPVWRGDWDVEHAELDEGRRRLAWTVNEDGLSTFHARDLETGRDVPVPGLPAGMCTHFAFSPD